MRKVSTKSAVALLLICGGAISAFGQGKAQKKLMQSYNSDPLNNAQLGVLAVRMNGDTVACVNPSRKLVPASNMKLISTGVALNSIGGDYRFKTSLAYSGVIRDSVLVGDLYIVGGGDPTTGSKTGDAEPLTRLFGHWAEIVRKAGIKRIDGCVVGDPRIYNPQTSESNGWSYEDIGNKDGAGPRGLNFFENHQNFYVTPGASVGSTPFVRPRYPDTPWMSYAVSAVTSAPGTKNTLYYVNSDFGPIGDIRGEFPIDRKGYTLECSNKFGAITCAFHFYKFLYAKGITASGYADVSPEGQLRTEPVSGVNYRKAAASGELRQIGETWSEPLREIVADANKESNNFYAETIMHLIGYKLSGKSDYDSCIDACEAEFVKMGVKKGKLCTVYDGSGLSRKNYVAPEFFVNFLKAMTRSRAWNDYLYSLPRPGEKKGTLENRFSKYPDDLKNRVRCKTGSMNGVRCYSGYILPSDGNPSNMIVFSVMSNNSSDHISYISTVLEEIIAAIALEN